MAVQQRRGSKTRKAKRRTHYKLVNTNLLIKCVLVENTTANKSLRNK